MTNPKPICYASEDSFPLTYGADHVYLVEEADFDYCTMPLYSQETIDNLLLWQNEAADWQSCGAEGGTNLSVGLYLIIFRRADDYHCSLNGNSAIWDCGKTRAEAIGRWVLTHGRDAGITIISES